MSAKAKTRAKARAGTRKAGKGDPAGRAGKATGRRKPLDPSLNVRGEQPYVAIPIRVTLPEWGKANALVGEVFDWLAQRGIAPAGPLFYRYRVIGGGDEPYALEVGVPTAEPLAGDERVVAGTKPSGAYVTATHTGHPDRLDEAHDELQAWARERGSMLAMHQDDGRETWDGRFESFLTDPAKQPDLDRWSIEIAYLLDPAATPNETVDDATASDEEDA